MEIIKEINKMKIIEKIKTVFSKKRLNPNCLIHPDTPGWAKRADEKCKTKIDNSTWKQ